MSLGDKNFMDLAITQIQKNLDEIKKVGADGFEFWSARDLQGVLGYKEWRKFKEVVEKVKLSWTTSDGRSQDHFIGADKSILTPNGGCRQKNLKKEEDLKLIEGRRKKELREKQDVTKKFINKSK